MTDTLLSNVRQALLEDIVKYRTDLSYRLIYADWLEEYGSENDSKRAAFIRAQCSLSQKGYNVTDYTTQLDLLAENRLKWLAEDTKLHALKTWAYPQYRKGFLETISCPLSFHTLYYLDTLPLTGVRLGGDITDSDVISRPAMWLYEITKHKYWCDVKDLAINIDGLNIPTLSSLIRLKRKVMIRHPSITSLTHLKATLEVIRRNGVSSVNLSACAFDSWRGRGPYYNDEMIQDVALATGLQWLPSTWEPGE